MSEPVQRRVRRAARIVLLDPADRVLLFRYVPPAQPLFWILPGGACDADEDFASAARRELIEETGIVADPLPLDLTHEAEYDYLGEPVKSVEHFFHHRVTDTRIDTGGHTELERQVMQEHRWFTRDELGAWPETIYPRDLAGLVGRIAQRAKGAIA